MSSASKYTSILHIDDSSHPIDMALELQKQAAVVGFDWPSIDPVFEKLAEEINEIREAIQSPAHPMAVLEEFGDIFFILVNLARHLQITPLDALTAANQKFIKRFHYIEKNLALSGRNVHDASLEEMETLWQAAKNEHF